MGITLNKKGRPKKSLDSLPENWQKKILDIAQQGASEVEIRVALDGISDDLWYRWIKEEPEFSRTIKKAKLFCQAWWECQGRTNLNNRDFNHGLWYMNMKNRFGWKDKQDDISPVDALRTVDFSFEVVEP